jgi:hypothetical protein
VITLRLAVPAAVPQRRFPPPWSIEDIGAAFVVKDSAGQKPDKRSLPADHSTVVRFIS